MRHPHPSRWVFLAVAALLVPACGEDSTTVIQALSGPRLSSLELSSGNLEPAFSPDVSTYTVGLIFDATILVKPTAENAGTTILVNGVPVPSATSHAVGLTPGTNWITLTLFASNGAERSYFLLVRRSVQEAYVKASNTGIDDGFGGTIDSILSTDSNGEAASVAVSGEWMAVGALGEDSGTAGDQNDDSDTDSGAVYLFRRVGNTWSQEQYLKAPNIDAGDNFGQSVAMDGTTLVVGAPGEGNATSSLATDNNSAAGSGAVYVYRYSGGNWALEAYIKPSPIVAGDGFGAAVALQGDVLVVGAILHDGAVTNSGAAFVFRRSGTTWTQEAVLKASTPTAASFFGHSVALDGDAIVVGAWRETGGGAAYVFRRSGTSWTQETRLQPDPIENLDAFGWSVAVSGDVVAVGAPLEDSAATGINGDPNNNTLDAAGAVYVFRRVSGTWTQEAYVKHFSNAITEGSKCGASLALRGETLIVGAPTENGNSTGINSIPNNGSGVFGAVFVLRNHGGGWVHEDYLKPAVLQALDYQFGRTLAFDGQTLVVGAPLEDSDATGVNGDPNDNDALQSGAVYVFR